MTEAEWLGSSYPDSMLEFLHGRASDRKLRLFAAACCRRLWHLLEEEWSCRLVELVEYCADNPESLSGDRLFEEAWRHRQCFENKDPESSAYVAADMAREAAGGGAWAAAWKVVPLARRALHLCGGGSAHDEGVHQADLLRHIIGNPFRSIGVDPTWVWWGNRAVEGIARTIYDDRCFEDMPILADALEEAGCDNTDILTHCRQPGEHLRGCWVIDLILGKE
jgi:hypothetical protein